MLDLVLMLEISWFVDKNLYSLPQIIAQNIYIGTARAEFPVI
jgi:hypothetical protein